MSVQLRKLRVLRCMNASAVAEKAGMSRQRYRYIEGCPSMKKMEESTVRRLSDALGCIPYEIADIEDFLLVKPKSKEEYYALMTKLKEKYDGKF